VFTYLAAELRSGDIAVRGSEGYANWSARLLPREDRDELLGDFCAQAGLPASAEAFTSALRSRLTEQVATVDAGYPENTDLVIDEVTGVPSLRRRLDRGCLVPVLVRPPMTALTGSSTARSATSSAVLPATKRGSNRTQPV
jgi:hypothetical protein